MAALRPSRAEPSAWTLRLMRRRGGALGMVALEPSAFQGDACSACGGDLDPPPAQAAWMPAGVRHLAGMVFLCAGCAGGLASGQVALQDGSTVERDPTR